MFGKEKAPFRFGERQFAGELKPNILMGVSQIAYPPPKG